MEDTEIIELFLARNEDAIVHTSKKYGQRLRTFAFGIVEDEQTAEECENDVYLITWNSIPPHEPRDYFYSFLRKIARQVSLDRVRERGRQKRKCSLVDLTAELEHCLPGVENVESSLDAQMLGSAVSAYLRTLPEKRRNIFIRRYWYTDSLAQIAKRYGISEGNVKIQLFRTRKDLQAYLKKEGFWV